MITKGISSEKREKIKLFLDFVYSYLKNNNEKNTQKLVEEIRSRNLSTEYITALKHSGTIGKIDGIFRWLDKKIPTYKLTDFIIGYTAHIINKRNSLYKEKQIENIFKFMRNVYRMLGSGKPIDKNKINFPELCTKYNLKIEYAEALIRKNYISSQEILTMNGSETALIWVAIQPSLEDAAKIFNYVNNITQKIKKEKAVLGKPTNRFIEDFDRFKTKITIM